MKASSKVTCFNYHLAVMSGGKQEVRFKRQVWGVEQVKVKAHAEVKPQVTDTKSSQAVSAYTIFMQSLTPNLQVNSCLCATVCHSVTG